MEIIILTGYEEFEYAREAIKIGVAQYLSKPISGDELLKEVRALSGRIEAPEKFEYVDEAIYSAYEAITEIEVENQSYRKRSHNGDGKIVLTYCCTWCIYNT